MWFDGQRHRLALSELTNGRTITVYGQQEVVKDLIGLRLASGAPIEFEAEVTGVDGLVGERAEITYEANGARDSRRGRLRGGL